MRFRCAAANLIDLDWLVEATAANAACQELCRSAVRVLGKKSCICACRGDDYSASYFSPTPINAAFDLIRASSAIPGFTAAACCSTALATWTAASARSRCRRAGLPRRPDHRGDPYRPRRFYTAVVQAGWSATGESSSQPLVNLVHHHETTYRAIQSSSRNRRKLRIFLEIYPQRPLRSITALGSRLPALLRDYKTGRQCGRYFLATVGNHWPTSRRCCHRAAYCPAPRRWWRRRCRRATGAPGDHHSCAPGE